MANRYRRRSVPPSNPARRLAGGDDARKHVNSWQTGNSGLHHSAYLANVKKCQRAQEPLYFRQYLPNFVEKPRGLGCLNRIRAKINPAFKSDSKHRLLRELLNDDSSVMDAKQTTKQVVDKNVEKEEEKMVKEESLLDCATSAIKDALETEYEDSSREAYYDAPVIAEPPSVVDESTSYRNSDVSIYKVDTATEDFVETVSEATGSEAAIILEEDAATSTDVDSGIRMNETCVQTGESLLNTRISKKPPPEPDLESEKRIRDKLAEQLKHMREMARGETSSFTTSAGPSPSVSDIVGRETSPAELKSQASEVQMQVREPYSRKHFMPMPKPPPLRVDPPPAKPIATPLDATAANPGPSQLNQKTRSKTAQVKSQRAVTQLLQRQKEDLRRRVSYLSKQEAVAAGSLYADSASCETISMLSPSVETLKNEYTFPDISSDQNESSDFSNPFTHKVTPLASRRQCAKGEDCPKCEMNVPQTVRLSEKPSLFTRAFVPPHLGGYNPQGDPPRMESQTRVTSKPTGYVFNPVVPTGYFNIGPKCKTSPSDMMLPPVHQQQPPIVPPLMQIQRPQKQQFQDLNQQQLQKLKESLQQQQQQKLLEQQKMQSRQREVRADANLCYHHKCGADDTRECGHPCTMRDCGHTSACCQRHKPRSAKKTKDSILCYECTRRLMHKHGSEDGIKRPQTGYCRTLIKDFENRIFAHNLSASLRHNSKKIEDPQKKYKEQSKQNLPNAGSAEILECRAKEQKFRDHSHQCMMKQKPQSALFQCRKQSPGTYDWNTLAYQQHNVAPHPARSTSRKTSGDSLPGSHAKRCSDRPSRQMKVEASQHSIRCPNFQPDSHCYQPRLRSAGDSSYGDTRHCSRFDCHHQPKWCEEAQRRI